MTKAEPKIVAAGAGSIGCYVGGCLKAAGRNVTLLARPAIAEAAANGLRISDLEGRDRTIVVEATTDPAQALTNADIVLVSVKSGQTTEMAELIARHAPRHTIIVSLQNGVDNARRIGAVMSGSGRAVAPGMVAFNVAQSSGDGRLRLHRGTDGDIIVQSGHGLADVLCAEGLPVQEVSDIAPVLWGKLLLNLNNALNALSGKPLAEQLAERDWRRLLAAQMEEALAAMKAAGIKPAKLAGVTPGMLPTILRLPNWLFTRLARRMLAIDPLARSSMWEDLERRRLTEIDELQGAVQRLGSTNDIKTPQTSRVTDLIRQAEAAGNGSPHLLPAQVRI